VNGNVENSTIAKNNALHVSNSPILRLVLGITLKKQVAKTDVDNVLIAGKITGQYL
jgi:hypothetical protein